MKFYSPKPSFASGEVSPLLAAREDLAAYSIGVKELTNFIVLPQGGISNRPGTTLIEQSSQVYNLVGVKLVPFVYNEDQSYCLAFLGNGTVHIYNEYGLRGTIPGSPYSATQLKNLRWVQSANVLYLFHQDVPVHMLKRYTEPSETWQFELVNFRHGPYDDFNITDVEIGWSPGVSGSVGTLYSENGSPFLPEHVGGTIKLEWKIESASDNWNLTPGDQTDQFVMFGPSTITSNGLWSGTAKIWERDVDETTFTKIRTYTSVDNNYNFAYSVDVEEWPVHFYVSFETDGGSGTMAVTANSGGGIVQKEFLITGYTDGSHVSAQALEHITGENIDPTDS